MSDPRKPERPQSLTYTDGKPCRLYDAPTLWQGEQAGLRRTIVDRVSLCGCARTASPSAAELTECAA